jgi:pilus assembly protein CpaC
MNDERGPMIQKDNDTLSAAFIIPRSSFLVHRSTKEGERMHRTSLPNGSAAWREKPMDSLLLFARSTLLTLVLLLAGLPCAVQAQTCSPESRPVVVLLNGTTRLRMTSRRPIKTITNPKEGLLTIRTVERDPTVVILVGTAPGITRLELEDAEGNREVREVVVQADVEYLTGQLRRAVPLSGINVIPNGTNSVILTGYVQRAEDIAVAQAVAQSVGFTVINGLRLNGVQQVQLDVVVAQVNRSKGRNFGFNFLVNARQTIAGSTIGNLITPSGVGVPGATIQPSQFGQVITAVPGTANLFGGVIGNAAGFLAFLEALENEGLAKLLAQPRLVTLSGNPASFLAGGEQAVPVPAGLGQVGVQFEEFGTRLNFLPIVLGNGRIHLEVEPEVSTLDPNAGVSIAGATVAGRATQRIHTTVELETGQTYVIGGLIQRTVTGTTIKVPILGQLPFVGVAFSTKTFTETDTELVVLVTPHLVDAQSCDQVTKVLPGQESRSPDDFELFLEGILEAPRGPRSVFQGNRYVPAFRTGPTADMFPCAGRRDGSRAQPGQPAAGPEGSCPAPAPVGNAVSSADGSTPEKPATLPAGIAGGGDNPVKAAPAAPAEPPPARAVETVPISEGASEPPTAPTGEQPEKR